MNLNELWKFISDNADALGVLLTLATIFGGIIGFLLKIIWERVTKSSERKNRFSWGFRGGHKFRKDYIQSTK